MRKLLCATVLLALTGCANVNGVMTPTWLGAYYDRQDSCQTRNNGGVYPVYCGSGNASVTRVNGTVLYIQGTLPVQQPKR